MMWIVTLIVLAVLAWFLRHLLRRNADTAARTPLEHDRDGLNPPLPGQRAATGDAEVEDAARRHVGAHLEADGAGGTAARASDGAAATSAPAGEASAGDVHRVEASVRTQPEPARGSGSVTESFDADSERVAVPGAPDPSAGGTPTPPAGANGVLDPELAARAAERSADTGGTGTAVLAGIAAAGGVAAASGAAASDEGEAPPDVDGSAGTAAHGGAEPAERTNAPAADTAGEFEPERHRAGTADGSSDAAGGSAATTSAPGERDPARDDARTNAPVGDTSAGAAARETPAPSASDAAPPRDARANGVADDDLANAPDADTAGSGALRDRSTGARSNLVAGTVTLGVGGATAAPGPAVLEDGKTPAEQAARSGAGAATESDTDRLAGVDRREGVREMMKILNLRDADATRLGLSKEDFARLWQRDAAAPDTLVDDVEARLRRMLG